ncbi:IS4/IS5 family transposase [Komagataeibacter medellinensis]|uniref:IS4/IS5 family transposase n=1 Tax=Komagataeibacter medellinensis TaxID=1177712 RepID=A0ABQ6VUD0_9PROT|nr:IS4/IS5 family transposase [Komagataeibacter medellinensis]
MICSSVKRLRFIRPYPSRSDSTFKWLHFRGARQERRKDREAPGRSRGGFGTKVCVAADSHGRALSFTLAPGQAHELPCAYAQLDALPYPPIYVVCDRGYASHKFREDLWNRGSRPVIPPRKNDPEVACPKWAYRHLGSVRS